MCVRESTGVGERQGARGVLAGPGTYKLTVAASLRTDYCRQRQEYTTPSSQPSNLFTHNLSQQMSSLGSLSTFKRREMKTNGVTPIKKGGRQEGKCLQKDQEGNII